MSESSLIPERQLSFSPGLAATIGLEETILLQHLRALFDLSERIIDRLGGTIEAESEPGRGTRFRIRLAAVPADDPPEASRPSGSPPESSQAVFQKGGETD